jgi:hypothetical protein
MSERNEYLFAKDSEVMQLAYEEFIALKEQLEEARRLQEVTRETAADLKQVLDGTVTGADGSQPEESEEPATVNEEQDIQAPTEHEAEVHAEQDAEAQSEYEAEVREEPAVETHTEQAAAEGGDDPVTDEQESGPSEKVSLEFSAEETGEEPPPAEDKGRATVSDVPPIKTDIAEHFNRLDESGRLFSLFKQYYTCLNEVCGGTVRVTMKDGFCSLWNYDAWEEFAFVDIFEGELRIALDPRYTDALKSLQLCEVPRLLASRRNVICVQINDLNNTVLDILAKAFSGAGVQAT